jgi:hypothetical protein
MRHRTDIEQIIEQSLLADDIASPFQLLCLIAHLVATHHAETIGFDRVGNFSDGLDSFTGHHSTSLADSIRNLARAKAAQAEMLAELRRRDGQLEDAKKKSVETIRLRRLVEVFDRLLQAATEEGERLKKKGLRPDGVIG